MSAIVASSVSPMGIEKGCANSILIKVNQIGSLTETLNAIEMAHRHFKLGIVVDTVMVEFGRSAVHTDHYVFTRFVSGSFDGCDDRVQSIFRTSTPSKTV